MKLDLFAERRRQHPELEKKGDSQAEAPDDEPETDEPKSFGDRLKQFAEVLQQPIGQAAKDAAKGKGKGKAPARDRKSTPAAKPKSWAEEMGLVVPDKPTDPKARQAADDAIAQGTYHLKRGNRETDVQKKIVCFEEALKNFQTLKSLMPNDANVSKQTEMIERGLVELRSAFERYRAMNPEIPVKP